MAFRHDTNSIITENLSLLGEEARSYEERRLAQLRERAILIARNDELLDADNRTEEFSSLFEMQTCDNAIAQSTDYLAAKCTTQLFFDKLTVCKFLASEYKKRRINVAERLFGNTPMPDSVKTAYFQNAYADAAFRIFSEVIDNLSAVYESDFTSVCEEVYYGRADVCMLPLDSSRDAKLISFYRLIDKYELCPVFSCDVTTPDGNVTTRYALLKRAFTLPTKERLDAPGLCLFEFNITPDECSPLCDVLAAAKECGLTLYKVDSMPLSYSSSEFAYDVILKIGSADGLDAFALFLALAVPQYEPIGIYPHIHAKNDR